MPNRNAQEHARQLIIEGRLNEAAKTLLAAWHEQQGAGGASSRLAAGLSARLAALEKSVIKGVISPADADLERNRITDGLLYLANRLTDDSLEMPAHLAALFPEKDSGSKPVRSRIIGIGLPTVLAAAVLFLGWKFLGGNQAPKAFDLKINLHEDGAGTVDGGKVSIKIGDTFFGPEEVNSEGRAVFTAVPGDYLDDAVALLPVDLHFRYAISSQSARTAGETENQTITFFLSRIPDTTMWRGIVLETSGRPASRAILDVEGPGGAVRDTTGDDGRFEMPVPGEEGAKIQVVVWIAGRRRADNSYVLTGTGQTRIIVYE